MASNWKIPDCEKVLQKLLALSLMNLSVIAFCRLQSGRHLNAIDVARFDLGLHEEVENIVDFPSDDAEIADFGLVDDWLGPFRNGAVVSADADSVDRKEAAGFVPESACFVVEEKLLRRTPQ